MSYIIAKVQQVVEAVISISIAQICMERMSSFWKEKLNEIKEANYIAC